MKYKLIITISLVLLMIAILTTPVLSAPAKGTLTAVDTGTGKFVLQVTKDYHLKATVSLRGAQAKTTYTVKLYDDHWGNYHEYGSFTTNKKGSGRLMDTRVVPTVPVGPRLFIVEVYSGGLQFYGAVTIYFE
jgi:hypothetical protein